MKKRASTASPLASPRANVADRVRSPKLSHLVAERLRSRIANGELKPGDTLPPEGALLAQFGVSRPTLREALRVLESETLIRLGRGARSGATVLGISIEPIAQYGAMYLTRKGTTFGDVQQVRAMLEPHIIALLAALPKKPYLAALQECARALRAALEAQDFVHVIAGFNTFHALLGRFSENQVLNLIGEMLHGIVTGTESSSFRHGRERERQALRKKCEKSVEAYERLVVLIETGKARQAEVFWSKYWRDSLAFMARTGWMDLRVQALSREP